MCIGYIFILIVTIIVAFSICLLKKFKDFNVNGQVLNHYFYFGNSLGAALLMIYNENYNTDIFKPKILFF